MSRASGEESEANVCKVAEVFSEGFWALLAVVPLTMLDSASLRFIPAVADRLSNQRFAWRRQVVDRTRLVVLVGPSRPSGRGTKQQVRLLVQHEVIGMDVLQSRRQARFSQLTGLEVLLLPV